MIEDQEVLFDHIYELQEVLGRYVIRGSVLSSPVLTPKLYVI